MDIASETEVLAALGRVSVWPPDLSPDARYSPLGDIDVPALSYAIRRRLGDATTRVGSSVLMMGITSRLWAMTVLPAAQCGVLPDPESIVVREEDGSVFFGVTQPRGWCDVSSLDVHEVTLHALEPLVSRLALGKKLSWGNAAACLYAVPRVHDAPETLPMVRAMLALAPYDGRLTQRPGHRARRRSCCLLSTVPETDVCGDCVLVDRPNDPLGTR